MKTMLICICILGLLVPAWAQSGWEIVVSQKLQSDSAIQLAVQDLQTTGTQFGINFSIRANFKNNVLPKIVILSGDTRKFNLSLRQLEDEQSYQIVTQVINGQRTLFVNGGSVVGTVYGLYWIWDRLRVFGEIPEINVVRTPAMKIRLSLAWGQRGSGGETQTDMQNALRYSINWVSGKPVLDLVPWKSGPEASINARNREITRELIQYAHSLHLQYFSFANEFTYHPSILEEFNARLSPDDPSFWDALQAKYRRLFQALPELDGIELCNDDISGFWDNYRAFDVMHADEACNWPLERRFQTFVKKIYHVVVNEFDKTYFHFTWSLVNYEQHAQADVYRKIFTNDIPVKNLYLIPKITAADRWWHQPYNPTFNQTPHHTLVGFETMNYYETSQTNIFPTFPGQYFQAGMQKFLLPEDSNLKGSGFLSLMDPAGWGTRDVTAYVLYRLSWDPNEDIEQIARDFCRIHFGAAVADQMAKIYLLSPVAYKYGLHIEPVSYGKFNSFIHMRVGTFTEEGYPSIDGGKEHLQFLQEIYLRCKPWQTETLLYLEHGLATAEKMLELFQEIKPKFTDPALADALENRLQMTRHLIQTNIGYVRTTFDYFNYREKRDAASRQRLAESDAELHQAIDEFKVVPGVGYHLFGIEQLLPNVAGVLENLAEAEARLAVAPSAWQIENTITGQQERYRQVLAEHGADAVHFLHFEAEIDGRDILVISGDQYQIQHLRWDGPAVRECRFLKPLPAAAVTVVPRDLESRPIHPFILEQPSAENNFTTKVYLYDKPGGKDWVKFDLYYIPQRPASLGLKRPW